MARDELTTADLAEIDAQLTSLGANADVSDIPEQLDWTGAVRGQFYRPVKEQITLRIDADVLAWFRGQGGKYQTAVNDALREHVTRQVAVKRAGRKT